MTTGSIVRDNRVTVNTAAGPSKAGSYYSKTWNGADLPKMPKPQKPSLASPQGISDKVVIKEIRRNNRALIEQYKAAWASRDREVKRLLAQRKVPHNYTMSMVRSLDAVGSYTDNGTTWYSCTFANMYGGASIFATPPSSNDWLDLSNKLREKLIGSDFNLGVFLAESLQASEMIANAATRLAAGIKYVRKGNFREAARSLTGNRKLTKKELSANNWLELQFGWRPLLGDLDAGAKMLAHMNSSPFSARVSARKRLPIVASSGASSIMDFKNKRLENTIQVIAYLTEVDVPQLIGLTDVASVAWEKLPWSFVCDWAIPIGNYLSARSLSSALKGTFVSTSFKRASVSGPMVVIKNSPKYQFSGIYHKSEVSMKRTVSSTLSVSMPKLKANLLGGEPWVRATNAVALLVGQGKHFKNTY